MKKEEILKDLEEKLVAGEVQIEAVENFKEVDEQTQEAINAGWKCVFQVGSFGIICR